MAIVWQPSYDKVSTAKVPMIFNQLLKADFVVIRHYITLISKLFHLCSKVCNHWCFYTFDKILCIPFDWSNTGCCHFCICFYCWNVHCTDNEIVLVISHINNKTCVKSSDRNVNWNHLRTARFGGTSTNG